MDENPNNICVFVRVRPLLKEEIARGEKCCVKVLDDEQKIQVTDHGSYGSNSVRTFQFDGCLSPAAGQELLMPKLRMQKLLDSVLEGYSSTVMAYGQTGSGKTYTMCGCHEIKATHVMDRGLIAQAVAYLFNVMRYQMEESKRKLYGIRASYFEIYNEQVNDLLRLDCLPREVRWDVREGYFVDDLLMVECESAVDVLSVLIEGGKNRKVGSHNMNKDSSRSHCILTLHIDSHSSVGDEQNVLRRGRLLFVDLAGSERLKKSRSGGEMLRETGNINRSLLTLGKVISALADGRKDEVVPYRESMLTKLIMESLGGNSHAIMIACVSPSASSLDQTLSTLHYATCTKKIVNVPSVNMDEKDRIILKLQKKILELVDENVILKSRLGIQSSDQKSSAQSQSHPGSGTGGSHDNIQNMKEKFCQQLLHHDEAMLSVVKYSTENQSLINSKSVESFFDKWQTSQRNNSAWKNEPSIYQSLDEKKLQQERVQRPGRKHRISVDHLSPGIKTEVPPRTSSRYGVRFQGNIIVNHNAFMRLLDRKEPLGD